MVEVWRRWLRRGGGGRVEEVEGLEEVFWEEVEEIEEVF